MRRRGRKGREKRAKRSKASKMAQNWGDEGKSRLDVSSPNDREKPPGLPVGRSVGYGNGWDVRLGRGVRRLIALGFLLFFN